MDAALPLHAAITVRGLDRSFGPVRALDGVTLDFTAGYLHGIIGPDGAGKTTLLRILAGLLRPGGGSVAYEAQGRPVSFDGIRPRVAYMPSRASLYADLSIEEHLLFFKNLYSLPDDVYLPKARELLSITRLERFKDRAVGQLSGGMYKKTGLMCALLRSPSVLLLDEPTNGVDPISRREFWEMLYELSRSDILILLATAYMDEAERCGRVHLLDAGRVVRSGEPSAILATEKARSFDEIFLREARP